MKKTLQIWGTLVLILFLFPVLLQLIPGGPTMKSPKILKEKAFIVYASNITEEETVKADKGKALLYFTHSHEAYEPVTQAVDGKVAVSHQTENITKFGEKLKNQLGVHGVETDVLPIDNANEMRKNGLSYGQAYKAIRPHVEQQLQQNQYGLVIDLHRDSLGASKTTMVHAGEKYAKVAFVIGMDHPNAEKNKGNATFIKNEMEKLVPGITRGLVLKGGAGVDGKYNQDLGTSVILIELGGKGNSEDELNRTVAVIAQAAAAFMASTTQTE